MSDVSLGIDFGTTNSLVSLVLGGQVRSLTDDGRPHPSVVWYRGDDVIVGPPARRHLDSLGGGIDPEIVRSPKTALRHQSVRHVLGRTLQPAEVVAEVLRYLKQHAAEQGHPVSRAVMTVPIDFGGVQRRTLRDAARRAGISVLQFVHEPAAALYAHLRGQSDFRRALADFEGRLMLVFDWGGGTLDLTLCRLVGGVIKQVASRGNNDVGGDVFDDLLRNHVLQKHARAHGIADVTPLEQPGARAALLHQCEERKIELSSRDHATVFVKDFLRGAGPERNLAVELTRSELEEVSQNIIAQGLREIDALLESARIDRRSVSLCLATGGMVNMPAIRDGLVGRFGGFVPQLSNADRIISEGAAWIAHDGLRLTLAKPIEVVVADGSARGSYLPLVREGMPMPIEGQVIPADNRRFYCVDPRDGQAVFEFVKPRKVGLLQPQDEREALCVAAIEVDSLQKPLVERLSCEVRIDSDYVAQVILRSSGRDAIALAEFHNLDFALALGGAVLSPQEAPETGKGSATAPGSKKPPPQRAKGGSSTTLRSNVSDVESWHLVPGDVVPLYKPNFMAFDHPTDLQVAEWLFHKPCHICGRKEYAIRRQGPIDLCREHHCPEATRRLPH